MILQCPAQPLAAVPRCFVLRFSSLHDPGRGITVPCDASGHVDLDGLSDSLKNAYLAARVLMGREFAFPIVQPAQAGLPC